MVVGAGFMLDGVRRSAKLGRDLRAEFRSFPGRGLRGGSEPEREAFECYSFCTSCRYIDPEGDDLCPSCGQDAWLDLQLVEMTRILRENEDYSDEQPSKVASVLGWLVVAIGLAAFPAAGVLTGFFADVFPQGGWIGFGLPLLFGIGGFAIWLGIALHPILARMFHHLAGRPDPLLRWAVPAVDIGEPVAGEVDVDRPLEAPLTGRACAAWCLTAHLRAPGEREPTPVLVEHRSAPMTIAGRRFEADTFAVARLPRSFPKVPRDTQARVVRQRGLMWSDGEFIIREAIIPVGMEVKSVVERKEKVVTSLRPKSLAAASLSRGRIPRH